MAEEKKEKLRTRRAGRECAMKYLFERLVNGSYNEITYDVLANTVENDGINYFERLVSDVSEKFNFLKDVVSSFILKYDSNRIYKIDLAILMIATNEILFYEDLPNKVAINEAIEISKIYSTDNSPSFINGILGSILEDADNLRGKYESIVDWWKKNFCWKKSWN